MSDIPINSFTPQENELKLLPLGNITPYDFFKPHRHDYFEIFFFTKGGGKHFIDFIEHEIQSNSVHIVFPQQVHLVNRSDNANGFVLLLSRNYLHVLGKVFYPKLLPLYHFPTISFTKETFTQLLNLLQKLSEVLKDENELGILLAQNYTSIILAEIIKSEASIKNGKDAAMIYSQQEWETYKSFVQLLETHFLSKNTVQFYAESLHKSEKVLNNCIRKISNKTCTALIQERTLIEAKRLLLFTSDSIKEVAFALNFQDSSYFTRFFIRMAKMTPKEFKALWEEKCHS